MLRKINNKLALPITLIGMAVAAVNPVWAHGYDDDDDMPAHIKIFAPGKGDVAGIGSRAFLVDMAIQYNTDLASTGVSPELTGPGPLANAGPFPGTLSPRRKPGSFSWPGRVAEFNPDRCRPGPERGKSV